MSEMPETIQNDRDRRRKVYIVNKSAHNFSAAYKYGDVIFLSEGPMDRYSTNNMIRMFSLAMRGSHEDDYIVPCSLNVMNCVASSIFSAKHKHVNLLLFKDGRYIERDHDLNFLFGGGEPDAYYQEDLVEVEEGSSESSGTDKDE